MAEKIAEQIEQFSMGDIQMAMVKAILGAQSPLDASLVYLEVQGEILQLTLDYAEQCARVVEATVQRLSAKHIQ